MAEFYSHKNFSSNPPPPVRTNLTNLSIIQKLVQTYKLWDEFRNHFPKKSRYTLGAKIDSIFIDAIELLFIASYLGKEQKLPYLQKAGGKIDLLKFFLQIAWELEVIDNNKYILLSKPLDEIGRMIGGWIKGIQSKTLAT